MGVERDYLMRQLMQLFAVIHKILGHREKGEYDAAEKQVRYIYSCLRIDGDVHRLTIPELLDYLQKQKKLSNEQIELFAFVLKEQGELADDETLRLNFFTKACFLLEKVERESISFSMERQMRLQELKSYLN